MPSKDLGGGGGGKRKNNTSNNAYDNQAGVLSLVMTMVICDDDS